MRSICYIKHKTETYDEKTYEYVFKKKIQLDRITTRFENS